MSNPSRRASARGRIRSMIVGNTATSLSPVLSPRGGAAPRRCRLHPATWSRALASYGQPGEPAISVFDAPADARGVDDPETVDLLQGGVQIGLDGEVGHDHQGNRAIRGYVVAGVVLDDAGNADPMIAQDLGQPGEHSGPVGDGEAQVI